MIHHSFKKGYELVLVQGIENIFPEISVSSAVETGPLLDQRLCIIGFSEIMTISITIIVTTR